MFTNYVVKSNNKMFYIDNKIHINEINIENTTK